ncbi:DUF3857 domain-containing protein [Bernardetia sp. OM2101]|uniref:DUF3857 domain-containing protein n=1 Tax=Bernardetia sp. OM2101 TaxID=3344876 RepID=UPI0035CFF4AB
MKRLFILLLLLNLFFFPISLSYGQFSKEHTSKFGKVSLEEVQMKKHDAFPEADAIILFETCKSVTKIEKVPTNRGDFYKYITYIDIHKRIKIFNKIALDQGNVNINYTEERHYSADSEGDNVTDIKATTYVEEEGKIKKYELSKDDIFEKNVIDKSNSDYKEISFALPSMKEGCVIEYSYTVERQLATNGWSFQHEIPVLWSEYYTMIPKVFGISPIHKGGFEYEINKETTGEVFDGGEGFLTRNIHLAVKNLPAFKRELYMTSSADHIQWFAAEYNSLQFDFMPLPQVFNPKMTQKAERLFMMGNFGEQLNKTRHIQPILDTLIHSEMSQIEKMAAIHKFVVKNFEHNKEVGVFTKGIKKTIDEKSGNAADLNFVMLVMLQEAGLFAEPMLLSTRENRKINPFLSPSIWKFNYMVAYVLLDQKHYFLDATQNHLPTGLLPFHCYNGQAWVVNKGVVKWFDISDGVTQKQSTKALLKLDEKGNLTGTMKITAYDHIKRRIADQLEAKNQEEYIKERIENAELKVESFEFEGLDDLQEPLGLTMQIKSQSAESTADLIYFTPVLSSLFEENPFKNPERTYPVDFGTAQTHTYMLILDIPQNYEVDEMPKSEIYDLLGGKAAYSYTISQKGNKIQIRCRTQFNEKIFSPKEYLVLRGFINQIMSKQEEQVVLKRIEN